MKTLKLAFAATLGAFFLAAPVIACELHGAKAETKAEVKTSLKKAAKATKAVKTVAQAKSTDKKI